MAHLFELMINRGQCVFDIGAHRGKYAKFFSKK